MNMMDFYTGKSFDAYEYFGAHICDGGVLFRVYAPNASWVSLVGSFHDWQEEPMQRNENGTYEFFCREAHEGDLYKYVIHTNEGKTVYHCDPYGFQMELRPNSASVVTDLGDFYFQDEEWMKTRDCCFHKPMNIFEVHAGSFRKRWQNANGWYHYENLAEEMIPYIKEMGYTHVEFLPLAEHPLDESWGYQNTGFFSPTSRYGTPKQLMAMVDRFHRAGIGVFFDFVPVHFAVDDYGLKRFDGTCLYEYPNNDVGASEWGSCNFMHSRGEVCSFLQSAANYWLSAYHFDGIRMDAISRAIYWQGDPKRGVNGSAVSFLKNMNSGLKKRHPDAILMAEDSTAFPGVTKPVEQGGLGFDYKWDLGFMNDTLSFMQSSPKDRIEKYPMLLFSMHYFYNENYLLPFSHDEVVHGKATIIQKMWGERDLKFSQCRLMYLYFFTHPGKKLNFMGNEFGQFREWDEKREQDWELLAYPMHDMFRKFFKKLGELYASHPALYQEEYRRECFQWLKQDAPKELVIAYMRTAGSERLVAIFNFSDQDFKEFDCYVPGPVCLKELIHTDDEIYGGGLCAHEAILRSKGMEEWQKDMVTFSLPPFSGALYQVITE